MNLLFGVHILFVTCILCLVVVYSGGLVFDLFSMIFFVYILFFFFVVFGIKNEYTVWGVVWCLISKVSVFRLFGVWCLSLYTLAVCYVIKQEE